MIPTEPFADQINVNVMSQCRNTAIFQTLNAFKNAEQNISGKYIDQRKKVMYFGHIILQNKLSSYKF